MSGREFRKWRREREITQQVVANYCDINKSTICRWEKELIDLREYIYLRVIDYVLKTN